jgi:antitoxin YefM
LYNYSYIETEGNSVKVMTFSDTRANLASALDAVIDDAEELVITRSGHEPVVVISLREYESLRETDYLMRGENGRQLVAAIERLEAGKGVQRDLIDE